MPMRAIFPILAQQARVRRLAAAALVAATALSFVTLGFLTRWNWRAYAGSQGHQRPGPAPGMVSFPASAWRLHVAFQSSQSGAKS